MGIPWMDIEYWQSSYLMNTHWNWQNTWYRLMWDVVGIVNMCFVCSFFSCCYFIDLENSGTYAKITGILAIELVVYCECRPHTRCTIPFNLAPAFMCIEIDPYARTYDYQCDFNDIEWNRASRKKTTYITFVAVIRCACGATSCRQLQEWCGVVGSFA